MDTSMSRRAFLKNAALAGAALIAAPALLSAVEPQQALAEATSGTCTCNVRVKPTGLPATIIGKNNYAYMTNPTTPSGLTGPFPTDPVSDNATYVVDGDTWTVTIPLVNTMFTLTGVEPTCTSHSDATATGADHDGTRYQTLVVTLPAGPGTHTFAATEYAGFSSFLGTKTWPIEVVLS